MKLKEFIKQFSHNNEIYLENRKRYFMSYKFHESDKESQEMIMDWELEYTDIADCDVIRISNTIRPKGYQQGITIVIDTDKNYFSFKKNLITLNNVPVWLFERVNNVTIEVSTIN